MLDQTEQTDTAPDDQEKADNRKVTEARKAFISCWCMKIKAAEKFWEDRLFKRIRIDRLFVQGYQWQSAHTLLKDGPLPEDERLVVNVTQRHIKQQTATLYGKNPKIVCRHKDRMILSVWDGSQSMLAEAQQTAMGAMQAMRDPAIQLLPDALMMARENLISAQEILNEAISYKRYKQQARAIAKTVEMVIEHCVDEQPADFKKKMKDMVRRSLICGLAHVKLTFNKLTEQVPHKLEEMERVKAQLAAIERLAKDVAESEITLDSDAGAEELRNRMTQLEQEIEVLIYEGLVFEYPDPLLLIFDPKTTNLSTYEGTRWTAEKCYMTRAEIRDQYALDVEGSAKSYTVKEAYGGAPGSEEHSEAFTEYAEAAHHETGAVNGSEGQDSTAPSAATSQGFFCVYKVYDKDTGVRFTICEGVDDYLEAPQAPDFAQERFFPYHTLIFNEPDGIGETAPMSETQLIRPMQHEINSAAEGLLEHRIANRPGTMSRKGALDRQTKERLANRKAHEHVEVNAQDNDLALERLIARIPTEPIDPNLYETNTSFQNILRVVGAQEAELGGLSGATATEAAIAQGAKSTASGSDIDALDDFLSLMMRAAGQLLLRNMSKQTVMKIAGETAVWPELSREEVTREYYLEIEAGSTGKPNQAEEVQRLQAVAPFVMQTPGVSPEWFLKELLRRLDDRLDPAEAMAAGMPSIQAMNSATQGMASPPSPAGPGASNAPDQQGGHGANNLQSTQPQQVNAAPRPDNSQAVENMGGMAA